jgi:hypothetical protein
MQAVEPSAAPQPPPPVQFNLSSVLQRNTSPVPQRFTPLMLHSSFLVIFAVKNHYVLARLLLWLLARTPHPGYLHVALGMVRACDEAFAAMEMLTELLDTLARLAATKSSECPPIANSCNALLAEILAKYRDTLLYRKWTEENPALVPAQVRAAPPQHVQSVNIPLHTQAHIRTVMSDYGPIPEAVEQIMKSSVPVEKIVTAIIQLFISTNDSTRNYARHSVTLLSLAEPACSKLGLSMKLAFSSCIFYFNVVVC